MLLVIAAPASADEGLFEAVRSADASLAQIGYRLATANAPLCDTLEPGLGLVLHTPSQYAKRVRADAVQHFHFAGPVAVEAVIAGTPAAKAGIAADDTIFSIGPAHFAPANPQADANTKAIIQVAAQVAELPASASLEIHGQRQGEDYIRTVTPIPACRTRFELVISADFAAQADGEMVQLSSRFFQDYPDDQIAAAIAHEFAHNILHHRKRLEEQGVSFGMLAGVGRNVRFFRQTELEADILSVSLLANAGYDPNAAVRFWRAFGPRYAGGPLRDRSHPAWQDRVATIERTIAELRREPGARLEVIKKRNDPLDGDWRSLLP